MLDRKGLLSYLLITFGITYAVEGGMIAAGFRWSAIPPIFAQYAIAAVMWVPALATVITVKWVTREGFGVTNLRFGNWRPYLFTALFVPLVFAIVYGLTWLLGLGHPDWTLSGFLKSLMAAGAPADLALPMPAPTFLLVLFLASLLVGPTINAVFGFGEELGWRGYLLPKLMPLGKTRAYLLVGVI